jgi:hypothetical protein
VPGCDSDSEVDTTMASRQRRNRNKRRAGNNNAVTDYVGDVNISPQDRIKRFWEHKLQQVQCMYCVCVCVCTLVFCCCYCVHTRVYVSNS